MLVAAVYILNISMAQMKCYKICCVLTILVIKTRERKTMLID